MANYHQVDVVRMLPSDIQALVERSKYKAEAEQLWSLLANYIANGSREFFVSWTDHGIPHIERIFEHAGHLITEAALSVLTSEDAVCLYTSILLHDIAMRFDHATVMRLLTENRPEYEPFQLRWSLFCSEVLHWEDDYLKSTFGDNVEVPRNFNFSDLKPRSFFLVGEFLRRNHGDLSRLIVDSEFNLLFDNQANNHFSVIVKGELRRLLRMSALIAKSHTVSLRDGIELVKEGFGLEPDHNSVTMGVHFPYIMAVLRLSDYLDFRNSSSQYFIKDTARIQNPISQLEHATMDAFRDPNWESAKMENILIEYATDSPDVYAHVNSYLRGIQHELDVSWAVLSECYHGSLPVIAIAGLTARRIKSRNLDSVELSRKYYSDTLRISVSDTSIIFLLAGPLYSYDHTYALREVLSNAHDACLDVNAPRNNRLVVELDEKGETISFYDSGLGMSIEDLSMFFLRVGGRLRGTLDWKVRHIHRSGKIEASYAFTSRFGVGIVSLFMLGNDVQICTQRDGCPGVKLSIRQQVKELVAEKWTGPRGTQITIKLDPAVRASLSKVMKAAIDSCEAGKSESDGLTSRAVIRVMRKMFRFFPFEYDIELKLRTKTRVKTGILTSVSTLLMNMSREWCSVKRSDGSSYKCCVIQLDQESDYRSLSTDRIRQAVVYNGIPVTVPELPVDKGVQSRDLLVIVDPQNNVRFNLQKTEIETLAPNLVHDCYRAQFLSRLNRTPQGQEYTLVTTQQEDSLFRYDSLEILRLSTTRRGIDPLDVLLPSIFFFQSRAWSLTSTAIRSIESNAVIIFDVDPPRVIDFISKIPHNIPFIITPWCNDSTSRFAPFQLLAEPSDLRKEVNGNFDGENRKAIKTLCDALTDEVSDANDLRNFLTDIAFRYKDKGIGRIRLVSVTDLAAALDSIRYQLKDISWSRPLLR